MTQLAQISQSITTKPASASVMRRCACGGVAGAGGDCADCAAKHRAIQRSASGATSGRSQSRAAAASISQRAGSPLETGLRQAMESRVSGAARSIGVEQINRKSDGIDGPGAQFEQNARAISRSRYVDPHPRFDFRNVRVHADETADRASRSIDADAYTTGEHIAFRANQFNPHTTAGRDLLAHELTHVVQQSGGSPALQRQEAGDRRVTYDEHVDTTTHKKGDPNSIWKAKMTRTRSLEEYEKTPAKGKKPAHEEWKTIKSHDWDVNLEFDPSACEVRIPVRLHFNNPSFAPPATYDPCNLAKANPTPRKPLDSAVFTQLRADFTNQLNSGLNGWYAAKIEGCKGGPCAGKSIPIRLDAHDGGKKEQRDEDIDLINASGRSCVRDDGAHIYAPSGKSNRRMWVHEGGHLLLGVGDEYEEEGKPSEFISSDYSLMGDAEKTRFASFHERHFAFVPVFLDEVLDGMGQSGCHASLQELSRPLASSFNFFIGTGKSYFPRGSGSYLDLGAEIGRSDSRDRAFEKVYGFHARLLSEEGDESASSFLVGARIGLNRRFGGSGHALELGGFAEAGGGAFDIGSTQGAQLGAYGELGGYLSYHPPVDKNIPGLRLEGAIGGRLGGTGQIGDLPPNAPSPNGPMEHWVRLGISVVMPF